MTIPLPGFQGIRDRSPRKGLSRPGAGAKVWIAACLGALLFGVGGRLDAQPKKSGDNTCQGLPATIVGTNQADVLMGTPGPDVIVGLNGDDIIYGGGGDDVICGGNGEDRIFGGDGNDVLSGDNARDFLEGGHGDDLLLGENGPDSLDGGPGVDELRGGRGPDTCQNGETLLDCEDETPNVAPMANAGQDLHAVVGIPVRLDGTESYDPDYDLVAFDWALTARPANSTALLAYADRPRPIFVPDQPGEYLFELTVQDTDTASESDSVRVLAFADDAPPNARAGRDRHALVGSPIALDGRASSHPLGHSVTFSWLFASVPAGSALTDADIGGAATSTPQFTPDVEGTFSLLLRVSTGSLTDQDEVEVLAHSPDVAPYADPGPDEAFRSGEPIALDSGASFDPDSGPSPLGFEWFLVSTPPGSTLDDADLMEPTSPSVQFTPIVEGSYLFRLEANDGALADAENVLIFIDDTPPIIHFVSPQNDSTVDTPTPNFLVSFQDDGAGVDLTTYQTTVNGIDYTSVSEITPIGASYTPAGSLPSGENAATASIADLAGNVQSDATHFIVQGVLFQAIADCAPTSGNAPLAVRFRSRGVFEGGSIIRYRWDFEGDGTFDTSDPVARDYTRTFSHSGTFGAVLEVTNNFNDTATDTCVIDVQGNAPTAVANASPSNGPVPLDVQFTCTGSDPDGTIVLYEWDFEGDGTYDFSSATSGATSHTYPDIGEFGAVCRVTDNDGRTGTARTTTTVIRPAPPGSPSVEATASPMSGNAPLTVTFNATVTDDGTIVLYEWDFDGDGTFEYSSTTSPATTFRYVDGGVFAPAIRVTDDVGLTGTDNVEVIVNLSATLSIPDDTFDPTAGETALVKTSLTAGVPVRVLIKNESGAVVRKLVDEVRSAGDYSDVWDGRDDAGEVLPHGPYFAVLEYDFDGSIRTVDLTNSTGGVRYNPPRNGLPRTFRPFEDDQLTITFTVSPSNGASEIQAFVGLFNVDTRIITLLERVPFGVGTHTIRWDGLDPEGDFAVPPPGDQFLFGIFGFTLPDNAIMVQSAPVLSNVTVDPNYFDPSTGDFIGPEAPMAIVSYDLSKTADVELSVTNLATGVVLRTLADINVGPGMNTISWDGKANNGLFADKGDYRLALRAIDSTGSVSLVRYALVRVFH